MDLLGTNFKLSKKVSGKRYAVRGLTLAPHSIGGFNVCKSATIGCMAACVLWFVGRINTPTVRAAMLRRKAFFFEAPQAFESQLIHEIELFVVWCRKHRRRPAIRLNVASDLDWSHIARRFPNIEFYDYTKVRSRLTDPNWPTNYELTLSRSEASHHKTLGATLRRGANVAVVFDTRYAPSHYIKDDLPKTWSVDGEAFDVIDGDAHDVRLRSLDGSGVIVGLRFKGSKKRKAEALERGFCVAT